ncbi:hypothetical protein RZU89_04175 [Campylobacter coli]
MDYKDTLLLPNTTFAMRANLAELSQRDLKNGLARITLMKK